MATLISRATGNFTSSSTWGVADNATGSQVTSAFAATNTTTSYVYSSAFTGTNTRVSDGIALFLRRINTTGTVTVALSDDNGVTATREVTVNASDLPADESWVFFKFGTTLTLDGGTDYRIGVKASSASNAQFYNTIITGNWLRIVSTTTTAAPAAGDTMLIVGELTGVGASSSYTVTMNNTNTTDFGTNTSDDIPGQTVSLLNGIQVCQNGTLTWGTSSATNYYLKISGHLIVWSGGTYNMGTSGTPCPRDSTMTLLFDSTGTSTTNAFGLGALNGATVSIYGQSRTSGQNIVACKLSVDAAVNATSLTVDTDTGWLDNDQIAIASTSQTNTQSELGALNGAAGSSTLTVDGFAGTAGGLAFSHLGTSPMQAEIINLSRNVIIQGNSTTQTSFIRATSVSAFNMFWCRCAFTASSSVNSAFVSSTSTITVKYCAFLDASILMQSLGEISYCCFSNFGFLTTSLSASTQPSTITYNTVIRSSTGIQVILFDSSTFSNNTAAGCTTGISVGTTINQLAGAASNCVAHSCGNGISITSTVINPPSAKITLTNFKGWRCSVGGLALGAVYSVLDQFELWGNNQRGMIADTTTAASVVMSNFKVGSDTTFTTAAGLICSGNSSASSSLTFNNCEFSPSGGIYAANTVDISLVGATRPMIALNNTALKAATEVSTPASLGYTGFIKSSKHDQTEGAFKSWFQSGIIERDTTIFNTASPSERLTPSSASIKLQSGSRLVAVDDLGTVTINVYVRKSTTGDGADYNGNQPRLFVRANPACGINADTLLDTMTVSNGTWEQLTGTTAAVDSDGALEFYVDCDGTVGWVNVDDWSVS